MAGKAEWVEVRDSHGQRVTCCVCHEQMPLDGCLADTTGEPFKAYYHWKCAPLNAKPERRS